MATLHGTLAWGRWQTDALPRSACTNSAPVVFPPPRQQITPIDIETDIDIDVGFNSVGIYGYARGVSDPH